MLDNFPPKKHSCTAKTAKKEKIVQAKPRGKYSEQVVSTIQVHCVLFLKLEKILYKVLPAKRNAKPKSEKKFNAQKIAQHLIPTPPPRPSKNNGQSGETQWPHALVSGASGLGSGPDRGPCVVFLGKNFTFTVPLSTQVYKWVLANFTLGVTLRWTSVLSRGKSLYS